MANKLKSYLADPFLNRLYRDIRKAGAIKSISVDITHACNIRCTGCYYFAEGMDRYKSPKDESFFDEFIAREKARGTNFVTIVGGEPSLILHRVKKIYDNFWMNIATNGMRKIPFEGFENMPIGISVWGDHETDKILRAGATMCVPASLRIMPLMPTGSQTGIRTTRTSGRTTRILPARAAAAPASTATATPAMIPGSISPG